MVTETITAAHEPHFGGLLSRSKRFLDRSRLDVGAAALRFQSNDPEASFSVEYHRARWMQAPRSNISILHGILCGSRMAAKQRLALDSKQNTVFTRVSNN